MPNPSPLRYPGGKNRLSNFIRLSIHNLNISDCTYVEPFAGGAGRTFPPEYAGVPEKWDRQQGSQDPCTANDKAGNEVGGECHGHSP